MDKFKRENRYIVFKVKDIEALPHTDRVALLLVSDGIEAVRKARGKAEPFGCVVVESDWHPEYEIAWDLIKSRVEGKPNEIEALKAQLAERDAMLKAKDEALKLLKDATCISERADDFGQLQKWVNEVSTKALKPKECE